MSETESQLVQALILVVLLSAIPLGASLLVGLISSVLQAATQIQEQTLSFVPKLAAVIFVLTVFGPWMCREVLDFSRDAFFVNDGGARGTSVRW